MKIEKTETGFTITLSEDEANDVSDALFWASSEMTVQRNANSVNTYKGVDIDGADMGLGLLEMVAEYIELDGEAPDESLPY